MSFSKQYAALEAKFKAQVDRDNEDFRPHGFESKFLANIAPKGPVDYILVAMEPSFGGGSGIPTPGKALNSRNFAGSLEDFILHYCVKEYLCEGERTYYLTDLSQGAMPVAKASSSLALRYERYKRWYTLICEEIELVGPNAPIIPVGYVVRDFLEVQNTQNLTGEILHYSPSAAAHRPKIPDLQDVEFSEFKKTVDMSVIEMTIRRVMEEARLGSAPLEATLKRLRRGSGLTKSRKQLMFTYKCQFEKILKANAR
ncbi:MAG: hypothetical protein OXD31_19155 [Chloroflexi bacterium]|nr:hypothetical protein [Chloroflexota bacterium]